MRIVWEKEAYRSIVCQAKKNNFSEVGGILLGYRKKNDSYIVDFTLNTSNSRSSVIINGESESRRVSEKAALYSPSLEFVGVWHSHINGDSSFSSQDIDMHNQLLKYYDEFLSVLFVLSPEDKNSCTTSTLVVKKTSSYPL